MTAKARALIEPDPGGRGGRHRADAVHPLPAPGHLRALGVDGEQWPRFYEWSEAVIPGETELSEEAAGAAAGRDVGVPDRRGRAAPAERRRRVVSALATVGHDPSTGRRAQRGRAGHVPDPVAGGRQRDDPQPALGRAGGAGRAARAVGGAAGGPVARCRAPSRSCCAGPPGDLVHAHGHRRHHHPGPGHRRGRPGAAGLRLGQPGRGGVRARRRPAPDRPPPQSARELRLRPALLSGGGLGPARGPGRARPSCSTASRP